MSSAVEVSQAELLQRGRDKLAAFRQQKAAQRAAEAQGLQQVDAQMDGQQQTDQAQAQTQPQAQPPQQQQAHPAATHAYTNGHAQHAQQQQQQHESEHAQQAAQTQAQASQAQTQAQAQGAAPQSAAEVNVTPADVQALQQQYAAYWQQYGNDPQYAGYFQQLQAQIQNAQQWLQYAQAQQQQAQQQQQQPQTQQQQSQQYAPADESTASVVAAPVTAGVDYSASPTVQSFSAEQRASFLGFAQYYHMPEYAAYYADMATKPEYQSYFQTMHTVQQELAAMQANANAGGTMAEADGVDAPTAEPTATIEQQQQQQSQSIEQQQQQQPQQPEHSIQASLEKQSQDEQQQIAEAQEQQEQPGESEQPESVEGQAALAAESEQPLQEQAHGDAMEADAGAAPENEAGAPALSDDSAPGVTTHPSDAADAEPVQLTVEEPDSLTSGSESSEPSEQPLMEESQAESESQAHLNDGPQQAPVPEAQPEAQTDTPSESAQLPSQLERDEAQEAHSSPPVSAQGDLHFFGSSSHGADAVADAATFDSDASATQPPHSTAADTIGDSASATHTTSSLSPSALPSSLYDSSSSSTAAAVEPPTDDFAPTIGDNADSTHPDLSSSPSSSTVTDPSSLPSDSLLAPPQHPDLLRSPSTAELPSTVSLDYVDEASSTAPVERSASPVLLRGESQDSRQHSRQLSHASETATVEQQLAQHDMPPLDTYASTPAGLYTLHTQEQQLFDGADQQQVPLDMNGLAAHPDAFAGSSFASANQQQQAQSQSGLQHPSDLQQQAQQQQAQLLPHPHPQHHSYGGALMSSSDSVHAAVGDFAPSTDGAASLRDHLQVSNLSKTIASLSQEVDSLRAENARLFQQQSLLRKDVGDRNARMEQVQHDNVALLLEMEKMEAEVTSLQQALQTATARAGRHPALHAGGAPVSPAAAPCEHGEVFAELHELQLQMAGVWQKSVDLTQSIDDAVHALHHRCAVALQQGADPKQLLRLTNGVLPTGISATPAGTSSAFLDAQAEAALARNTHQRSESDPGENLSPPPPAFPSLEGAGEGAAATSSEEEQALAVLQDDGVNPSTPPRRSSLNSASGEQQSQALVPTLSAVVESVASLHDLVRAKTRVEAQLFALLRRVQELCEPVATLLGSGGGSEAAGGVQRALKAMQKQTLAHAQQGPVHSRHPGGAVPQRGDDHIVQQQLAELRASRDALAAQLAAQVERAHLLIKDKILLAKKIEDTYEERQLVVENLREQIQQLREEQGQQGEDEQQQPQQSQSQTDNAHAPRLGDAQSSAAASAAVPADRSHRRYDSALSPSPSPDTVPAGAAASSDAAGDSDLRDLNSFYVAATRPQPLALPTSPLQDATATAASATSARAESRADTPSSTSPQREDDEAEADALAQAEERRGLLSSLISFFRSRFSQSGYEQALLLAQRRRRAQMRREQALRGVQVVAI